MQAKLASPWRQAQLQGRAAPSRHVLRRATPRRQRAVAVFGRGGVNDPYDVLDVPGGSSREVIKAAYRRLMKELHPDLSGYDTTAHAAALNAAYEQAVAECDAWEAGPAGGVE